MNGKEICKEVCCGCTACGSVCPKEAITFNENARGFLEPVVNQELCINCNLCSKTCNSVVAKNTIKKAILLKHKDNFQHTASQSGGAFVAISDIILRNQGSVFGVIMDDKLEAKVAKADDVQGRDLMRGSKYMQARVEDSYVEIKNALAEGFVLFVGTPCQIGGLYKYLNKKNVDFSNLYTVDLICHGTPSVRIWREMKRYIAKEAGDIKYAVCRDKIQTGWGGSISTFYGDKKISSNLFCKIFFTDLCLRDSCYECQYSTLDRVGDLTIGDAWGVRDKNPEFYDSMGVSLVCINTEKGYWLFENFKQDVFYKEVNIADYKQKNMDQPSIPHRNINEFWEDFDNKPFSYIKKKYGENNILLNYRYAIKKVMRLICGRK